jgi:hypothetical protein
MAEENLTELVKQQAAIIKVPVEVTKMIPRRAV